jgi:hypothetical protein
MALVWVLFAFVELFLYLPLLSGAFLAYAQLWATDPMPAISPIFLRQANQHSWWCG